MKLKEIMFDQDLFPNDPLYVFQDQQGEVLVRQSDLQKLSAQADDPKFWIPVPSQAVERLEENLLRNKELVERYIERQPGYPAHLKLP